MIEIGDSSGESSVQLTRLSGLYSNPRAGNFNCRHQGILIVADQRDLCGWDVASEATK